MKSKLLLLLLSFTLLASAKTVTIKGHINGKLPETLYYTAPVNGAAGFDIYYIAKVDARGNFEIKARIDDSSFIDVYYNYQPAGYIIAQPDGQYTINITETDGKIIHDIKGNDVALQQLYNSLVTGHRRALAQDMAMEAAKIEDPQKFEEYFDRKYDAEFHDFSELEHHKTISRSLFGVVIKEREYFYAAAKSLAIYIKHIYADREDNPPSLAGFDALWPKIYEKSSADAAVVKKLPEGNWFLMGYEFYSMYKDAGFSGKNIWNSYKGMSVQQIREKRLQYIPAQNAEYYFATDLYSRVYEGQKEKAVLDAYDDFKKLYPNSGYTKYLEPKMAPVIAFFAESENLPQGAAYVEGYAKINTFEELVKKFPGKKLYFDMWATWCGPCREEFKYKDELYKLLKANDITVVYISLDKEDKDETWKKMIGHYGLQGYHVRTNQALGINLSELFNNGTRSDRNVTAIPWYILVNANGTIAALHAAPPSEMEKLEVEIKKL